MVFNKHLEFRIIDSIPFLLKTVLTLVKLIPPFLQREKEKIY